MEVQQTEAADICQQHATSSPTVAQLLAENAALRAKLSLTEAQRVAQDVAREQLSKFFDDAARPALPPVQDEGLDGEVDTGDHPATAYASSSASFPRGPVSATIAQLTQLTEAAERRARELQENVVLPLNNRVEALAAEKSALQQRVQTLEHKLEAQPAKPLVKELDLLRLSESVLRDQLKSAQEASESRVGEIVTVLTHGASASRELAQQTKIIADLKTSLRDVLQMNKFLQLEQEEQRRRHGLETELATSAHEDEVAIVYGQCDALKASLVESQHSVDVLRQEKDTAEAKCAQLEAGMAELKAECDRRLQAAREDNSDNEENEARASGDMTQAQREQGRRKRRRSELDALLDDPNSLRGEVLRFYCAGKDTIAALEAEVAALKTKAEALRITQGRVVQLERAAVVTTAHITDLATEVGRLREENKQQRASVAGVEAERDVLATSLAGALSGAMSAGELQRAGETIREAATKAAAASAAIVADPEAIRDATRQAQELKSEVAQLQRQKEQLQRLIQLRQTRVLAQLEKDVLSYTAATTSPAAAAGNTRPTSQEYSKRQPAILPLDHVLARVAQCAKDIFAANEVASMGILDTYKAPASLTESDASVTPHKDSFLACQKQMEMLEKSCDEARHQYVVEQTMHQHTRDELARREATAKAALEAKEQALSSAHGANAALTAKLTATTAMLTSLRGQYDQVLGFAEQVLSSTHFLHHLLQSEHTYVDALRSQVQQEREEMCELLRMTWSAPSDEGHDPRVEASAQVADSLERLVAYLRQSTAEVQGRSEQETTAFVSRLADAIRAQEVRVRSLESTFDEATRKQAASLLQRVTEAQQHWDSEWERKCRALESERQQWLRGQDAQNALYKRLEHADLSVQPRGPQSTEGETQNRGAPREVPSARERARQTLDALESFLSAVRRIPPAATSAAPAPSPAPAPPAIPTATTVAPDAAPTTAARVDPISAPAMELSPAFAAHDAHASTAPAAGTVKNEEVGRDASATSPEEAADALPAVAQNEEEEGRREANEEVPEMPADVPVAYPDAVKKEEDDVLNTTE